MPRIRTIKPDFFMHEGIAELPALQRLLFIGLWTLADKDGRLEDRPRRIKAALLPWEDCDIDALLRALDDADFIQRYAVGDLPCIAIPTFSKHQRPHPKEPSAGLPPPPSREKKRLASNGRPSIPSSPVGREGKEILESGKEISAAPSRSASKREPARVETDRPSSLLLALAEAWEQEQPTVPPVVPDVGTVEAFAKAAGCPVATLSAAYRLFLRDPHWHAQGWPWRAWTTQWQSFVAKASAPPPPPQRSKSLSPEAPSDWSNRESRIHDDNAF